MNKDELIKKWLDNNLNAKEQKAFEQLEDYNQLVSLDKTLKHFKAPDFSVANNLKETKNKLENHKKTWSKSLLRLAAVLAIGFSVFYFTSTLDTEIKTNVAEQTQITLPDNSEVKLNANSYLSFNNNKWSKNRQVRLNGEAYFKVAKGQKFDVITDAGRVSVLGTEFNVKQRKDYFEVTCYEGLVGVMYKNKTIELKPGNSFKIIEEKQIKTIKEYNASPSWLNGESTFKNVPLEYVISEIENQYDYTINAQKIDLSRRFTGSFTHKNLDLALKSISLPLNLKYRITEKSITLERE